VRILSLAYGLACYLAFLVTFLYAPGFLANRWVPKSIDSGAEGAFLESLLINIVLLAVFGLSHSVMARPEFKARWTRVVPAPVERSTYVLVSSLSLWLLFWQWRPLPGVVWEATHPVVGGILLGMLLAGWLLVLYATLLIDHFELFGLRQGFLHWRGGEDRKATFVTPALYRRVRHPIYLGWLIFFWATPAMTVGHLLFAAVTSAYILAAIPLEERDLLAAFGDTYRRYRDVTPALIPLRLRGRKGGSESAAS
jgi:protein-S-isoprenylcysteine O-methyltransferase Ste14